MTDGAPLAWMAVPKDAAEARLSPTLLIVPSAAIAVVAAANIAAMACARDVFLMASFFAKGSLEQDFYAIIIIPLNWVIAPEMQSLKSL